MSKTVTLRLADETYEEFREAAEAQQRPLSNLIKTAALAKIREEQFTDDAETSEILSNEKLRKRLKKGSGEARKRKGRFVE